MKAIGYGIVVLAGSAVYSTALVQNEADAGVIGLAIAAFGAVLLVLDYRRESQPDQVNHPN
jgi:hypothetical protein